MLHGGNSELLRHARHSHRPFPSAIRKDNNSFASIGLLGPMRPLALLRWTSYSCPHCGYVLWRDFWPNKVRLGKGERICPRCSNVLDDGSREWPELSFGSKLHFFLPSLFVGIWGGLSLAGFGSLFTGPRDEHSWPVALVLVLFPLVLWCPARLIWVFRSKSRYKPVLGIHSS